MCKISVMPKRVLIIDDDPAQRRILEETIKHFGYEVQSAERGEEAVAILEGTEAQKFSLVLLDLVMPGMDGEETFRALRDIRSDLPIVVSSATADGETGCEFGSREGAAFLAKPYDLSQLFATVRDLLEHGKRAS